MIPDVEAAVVTYLKGHPDLISRVDYRTPSTKTDPWIRVAQLDANGGFPDYVVNCLVQLDVYAGSSNKRTDVSLLARKVREALGDMAGGNHSGAVVSRVRFTGHQFLPDSALEPARERVVMNAEVTAHPERT